MSYYCEGLVTATCTHWSMALGGKQRCRCWFFLEWSKLNAESSLLLYGAKGTVAVVDFTNRIFHCCPWVLCVWACVLGKGNHADVMLGWWRTLWLPSGCDKGVLLLLFVTSGCCCCWSGGDALLLPWVSWLESWPSWSELASDFSTAFSRSKTEFLSYSSLMCSFNTSTSSRTAYIRWLFTKSWKTREGKL